MRNLNSELSGLEEESLAPPPPPTLPVLKTHIVAKQVRAVYHPEEEENQNLWWSCPSCGVETHNSASGRPVVFPVECFCGCNYVVKVSY
jgi:hypothetical protein